MLLYRTRDPIFLKKPDPLKTKNLVSGKLGATRSLVMKSGAFSFSDSAFFIVGNDIFNHLRRNPAKYFFADHHDRS